MVATSREVIGRTLGELAEDPRARGVYLQSLQRGPELMPREPWTVVERGDILRMVGAPDDVERAATLIGFVERDLASTDLTFLAAGSGWASCSGWSSSTPAGIVLGLGTAGSILVVGLVGGWARSRYPVFGAMPEPAQRLLMDIGLIVVHRDGRLARGTARRRGLSDQRRRVLRPHLPGRRHGHDVPLAVGDHRREVLLKMSPLMALGGLAGAQTCTPGLNALREASGSNVGALAYTVPYAIGNILLTIWGPVVVAIVHAMRS